MKTIDQVMTNNVIWVSPSNVVKTAVILMKGHQIGALPVVHNEDAVVGMVSYQSLLGENPDSSIIDVMDKAFFTVTPQTTVHEAAEIMAEKGPSHLLVVDDGRLAGIVSHSDLLPELGKSFDPLTGLAWSDSLREWSVNVLKSGLEISIILLDLDLFGVFNKKYGHVTGDSILKAVAEVLKAAVDPKLDFLCRYGGDEFAIASLRPISEVEEFGRKIKARVKEIELQDVPEGVTCSFGIFGGRRTKEREEVHYAATLDDLINRASKNCTLAKPHRKGQPESAAVPAQATGESEKDGFVPIPEYAPRESRLKIASINFASSGALATVDVNLIYGANTYTYSVKGYSVGRSALRLVAEATAGAVSKSLPTGYGVVLDEVLTYGVGDDYQLITALAVFITPKASIQCIGTAAVKRGDSYRAAAAAMLNAINRHIAVSPRIPSPQPDISEEALVEQEIEGN
ncbi:MAG: GGDEF domain-containing protein [Armatimonadota bacterium]|nr:GGDEF domain-containing protein [Armatimonadota bacterium]